MKDIDSRHNAREILIHVILEYYNVKRNRIMKKYHSGFNKAGGMFCLICHNLGLGSKNLIGDHIERSTEQVYEYIRNYSGYVKYNVEFKEDYRAITEIFFTRERALFLDYYVSQIPKHQMAEFINYIAKFKVLKKNLSA